MASAIDQTSLAPSRARSLGPDPPLRDPMEDSDASGTRKRPRLDSGSRSYRSMSADQARPSSDQHSAACISSSSAATADTGTSGTAQLLTSSLLSPSKLPINTRDSSTNIVRPTLSSADMDTSQTETLKEKTGDSPLDAPHGSPVDSGAPSPLHSPEIEVAEIEDIDGEFTETRWRPLGVAALVDARSMQNDLLLDFPFLDRQNNLIRTLASLIASFEKNDVSLHGEALEALSSWMETYLSDSEPLEPYWFDLYLDRQEFWDMFPGILHALIERRTLKQGHIKQQRTESIPPPLQSFLVAYTAMALRMVKVYEQALQNYVDDTNPTPELVSERWLAYLPMIMTYDAPFWRSMVDTAYYEHYYTIVEIVKRFASSPYEGVDRLAHCSEMENLPMVSQRSWHYTHIVSSVLDFYRHHRLDENEERIFSKLPSQGFRYFLDVEKKLKFLISKQVPSLSIQNCESLVQKLSGILLSVAATNDAIATRVLNRAIPPATHVPLDQQADLAVLAWKMDVLKKCIMEGRMEIRVYGVENMQASLVDIYTNYINTRPPNPSHPIAIYLSDWLLANRMVEYFVGVESHPQLITRAANIVGFLSVTNRYTTSETDTIWNAIMSGQDPSKIDAVLRMAMHFFNISSYASLHYFLTKLSRVPLGNFDANMIEFGRSIFKFLREKWSREALEPMMSMTPIHLAIRLIRESATEKVLPVQKRREVQKWAMLELKEMLQYNYSDDDFGGIYDECLSHIEKHTDYATGSVSAITAMFVQKQDDVKRLTIRANLTALLVSDIRNVIKAEVCPGSPTSTAMEALDCRLKLLECIIQYIPQSISPELARQVWDVTVGQDALNDATRGNAWASLRKIQRATYARNPFIEHCINEFLPELHPSYFVQDCIVFAQEVDEYRSRFQEGYPPESQCRTSSELLWHISLATPKEKASVAMRCITTLISVYLDSEDARSRTRTATDAIHIELVERCIHQLTAAGFKLRSYSDGTSSGEDEPMVVVAPEQEIEAQKLTFERTLTILQEFVNGIRSRPMYSPEPQTQAHLPENFHDIKGDAVQLRYQAFGPKHTEIRTIDVGTLETAGELATRLKALTGFEHLRTIVNGHDLDLKGVASQTIGDLSLHTKGLLLIKKAQPPGSVPDLALKSELRAVEVEILSHFPELYQLLELEEALAKPVFTFLSAFPPHQSVTSRICSSSTPFEASFPVLAPFKILYSTFALRACLAHQIDNGANLPLVNQSIRSLTEAITTLNLDQSNLTVDSEAFVATALVDCLLAFLREPMASSDAILPFLNPKSLVHRLHSMILRGITLSHTSLEARKLVCEFFAAFLEVSVHSQEFRDSVIEVHVLPSILQRLLLEDSRAGSRQNIAATIQTICSNNSKTSSAPRDLILYVWNSFVSIIPRCLEFSVNSEQFFDTANVVFRNVDSGGQAQMDLNAYMRSWCELLLKHTHKEFVGRDEVDYRVHGLSRLILYCFQLTKAKKQLLQAPEGFMESLFRKHLFPNISNSAESEEHEIMVPNLRSEVRSQLLDLILLLSNDKRNYEILLNLMREITPLPDSWYETNQAWSHGFARITDAYSWEPNYNFERSKSIRSDAGHPGLRNLSNTCYMNSLLSQLFMNVKFRDFIVNVHVTDHGGSQKLLYETKRLFAYMQETFLKAVDTQSIADSIYYDGALIDVTVQMDVDEFYNLLFDRWESQIVDESDKKHFREFYGGQIVQQIKSRECSHISERLEPFFAVQCDITGKSTLRESLDAYVAGEVMEGDNKYSCTSCGTYVEAVKRACLKDIPDNLIFHLKRFDYDLMSGNRSKVNNRFEFPSEIDMAEYRVENLASPQDDTPPDVFELVGVLVHTGTSESGHYYSYIKERPLKDEKPNPWVEFNDVEVTFFDPEYIDDQCFGGWSENPMFMNAQWKSWNAYMLFYERIGSNALSSDKLSLNDLSSPAKCEIPSDLKKEVDLSNDYFLRQYCLFDPVHANFARNFLEQLRTVNKGVCTENHVIEQEAIWLALEYLDRYQSRTKDCPNHERMQGTLTSIIGACSQCCTLGLEWVVRHPFALRNLLLRCPMPRVRKDFAAMVLTGLQHLRTNDPRWYGFEGSDDINSDGSEPLIQNGGIFSGLVSRLESIFANLCLNSRGWDDYFGLLAEMSNMGKPEMHRLLLEGFLSKCLELLVSDSILAQRTPLKDRYQNYRRLVEKGRKFSFGKLSELVANLLEALDLEQEPVRERSKLLSHDHNLGPLTMAEDDLIKFGAIRQGRGKDTVIFLDKLLNGGSNPHAMKRIVKVLLLAGMALRNFAAIRGTLHAGISVEPAALAGPYLRAALVFCEYVPSISVAEGMIIFVAKEVDSIGKSGGREHLDFFTQARRLRNIRQDRTSDTFNITVLNYVSAWAPGLLTYCEESVRYDTLQLLKVLIFNHDINNLDDEEYADQLSKAGKDLGLACAKKCETEVKKQEPLENPKCWEQIQDVTKYCVEKYFDECPEEQIQAIEDVLAKLEALSVSDFEDPPSADNWNNSDGDLPSDSESDHFGASP